MSNNMGSIILLLYSISLGELPPPPPRACFGRDELIEKIIGFADNLTPFALIGAGGIGKTSIALTVLYHDRINQRFGDDRRFIRCDQIPASRAHFLNRLSKVIGVGIENPEDLTSLRSFLSSREMIIFLDNAESILDPRGPNAREIYAVVEELSQLKTVCLCITSRISTVPRHCERPIIPTLSTESAYDIFYGIYNNGGRSDTISDLLKQLDFHALSITLLATVASHNMWDYNRLAQEWDAHRTQVLRTDYNESLAATIKLSLASPTFRELGPEARELLGINAFFPQGISENSLNWLFPTVPDRRNIFDKFCVLSLAYRSNGFIVMLAPLRDYFRPKDPASSPLLCMAKDCYLRLLSVDGYPGKPGYEEVQCIMSEDVNVEYLLDIFTSIDVNSVSVWDACANFMGHLYWQKSRLVVLGQKAEGLPDDHPSKPECLFQLSWLFSSVGNEGAKQLIVRALKLWRDRGDDLQVARALWSLSCANRLLGLHEEGIQRAKEALEIYKRFNDIPGQAQSLYDLAWSLHDDDQLNAAEEVALQAIDLLPDKGEQFRVCRCHRVLGEIYNSKGETKRAIYHYDTALRIASHFNWHQQLFWVHDSLAVLFFDEKRFDDAHSHIEHAKSYAIKSREQYPLGRAMYLQAQFWYKEHSLEEAKSEASRAADVFENLGTTKELEYCRELLRDIEMERSITSGESNSKGELLEMVLLPTSTNSTPSARGTRNHLASLFRHILPRRTTDHI